VHTARRAGPSIRKRLDDGVAAGGDLVAEIDGRGLGEGRFGEAERDRPALPQQLVEPAEEDVAARLGDVE